MNTRSTAQRRFLAECAVMAIVASGLVGLLLAIPGATPIVTVLAAAYFLDLAWRIATAPPERRLQGRLIVVEGAVCGRPPLAGLPGAGPRRPPGHPGHLQLRADRGRRGGRDHLHPHGPLLQPPAGADVAADGRLGPVLGERAGRLDLVRDRPRPRPPSSACRSPPRASGWSPWPRGSGTPPGS